MKTVFTSLFVLCASTALADQSFSVYLGNQEVANGDATATFSDGQTDSFDTSWEGHSFDMPIYYGFRYTNWAWGNFGWGVDFTHSKAYPTDEMLAKTGFTTTEFTDGINVLTADLFYRLKNDSPITPYIGIGAGVNMPHVELARENIDNPVFEYQYGGLAVTGIIGASYDITKEWSVFTEAKYDRSYLNVDMDGGTFETVLNTYALNLGLSYRW